MSGWPCCLTSHANFSHKYDNIRQGIDRPISARSVVDAYLNETPNKSSNSRRPVSAARFVQNSSTPRRNASPRVYQNNRPLSVGRKHYPRNSDKSYDVGSLERRRLKVEETLRRYTTENRQRGTYRSEYSNTGPYRDMQDDLMGLQMQVNNKIDRLHAQESAIHDELERLSTDQRAIKRHWELRERNFEGDISVKTEGYRSGGVLDSQVRDSRDVNVELR